MRVGTLMTSQLRYTVREEMDLDRQAMGKNKSGKQERRVLYEGRCQELSFQ